MDAEQANPERGAKSSQVKCGVEFLSNGSCEPTLAKWWGTATAPTGGRSRAQGGHRAFQGVPPMTLPNEVSIRLGVLSPQLAIIASNSSGRSPQLAIRLGFWARVLAFLFRALPLVARLVVRVDAKHETHIHVQRTPLNQESVRLFSVHSVCIHDTPTFFTPGHNKSTATVKPQAPRGPSGATGDGARGQAPELPRARPTGAQGKAPQRLKRFISTSLTCSLTGACVRSSCGESPEHRRNAHARRTHAGPRTHAPTHKRT